MAGTTNASPGTPQPAVAMLSKLPISVLLSGPPGLGKENAPVAPARPKTLHESMLAIEAHLEAQKKADKEKAASKKREMAGLKLPVKKAAKMAKTDDAAATTSDATPMSISTTSTTATAKAPAGTKKAQTSSAGVDISAIHLDGEEDDRVPIFDSCDEVRRKINAHLKKPGVTQAQFCRDIWARMPPPRRSETPSHPPY